MNCIEPLESRRLLSNAIPGTIYFANADSGQNIRLVKSGGGLVLGYTKTGEKVNYTTQILTAGGYNLTVYEAATTQGNVIDLQVDGKDVTGNIALPATGDWNTYKPVVDPKVVTLPAGVHVITLIVVNGNPNLKSMVWTNYVQPPPPPPPPAGPPIPGTWHSAVDFNFATMTTLDARLTPHEWWDNGATVGEGQEMSDPKNVVLSGGLLHLQARIDNTYGTGWTGALVQTSGIDGNTSIPTFSFLYGYAQATMKIPKGQGLWPAFWMLPSSHNDANGELDVMESLDADPTTVYHTVHRNGVSEQHTAHTVDLSQGFHTYGVDWEPGSETFYIDGKATAVLNNTALISNEPARLILDLAVGGSWGGGPNATTPSPADLQVSDMAVWQH